MRKFWMGDSYAPIVVLLITFWFYYRRFSEERHRDLERMLEHQFSELDEEQIAGFERHYAEMLDKV